MNRILISVYTGEVIKINDSTPEGLKQYIEMSESEDYIEWFCYND